MQGIDALTIEPREVQPGVLGPTLIGEWPKQITVSRALVEKPVPHVNFGRRGSLHIGCVNGEAMYRRAGETVVGDQQGWVYALVESRVTRPVVDAPPPEVIPPRPPLEGAPARAGGPWPPAKARRYRSLPEEFDAFQWLPSEPAKHALPDWFMALEMNHLPGGQVVIVKTSHGMLRVNPTDWVSRWDGDRIVVITAADFARSCVPA